MLSVIDGYRNVKKGSLKQNYVIDETLGLQ